MTHPLLNVVDLKLRDLSHLELGHFVVGLADAFAVHPGYQGENAFPHPVSSPAELKELGTQFLDLTTAAETRDINKVAARDALRHVVELHPAITVQWAVIRSIKENDPSLIANLGLELKKKPNRNATSAAVTAPLNFKAKHGPRSGTAILSTTKVPKALTYEVGICQGDPSTEESWSAAGPFDHCRSIELTGLEPGKLYYFRVRCFGKGGQSPWSGIVSLRIL